MPPPNQKTTTFDYVGYWPNIFEIPQTDINIYFLLYRPDDVSGTGSYKAMAPDVKGNFDAAERRRQMIQESKFLGGDMEHTHLVKGLLNFLTGSL